MNLALFVYECQLCGTFFGVDEHMEDQAIVKCPVCESDDLEDAGSLAGMIQEAEQTGERKCRVCGCTDLQGCPEGCWWVEEDLCSSCEGTESHEELLGRENSA
ncbi:hypothetical protein [Alicyclobacillus sp. SO9]|uniref:hypothetical protein n=1 Tax=Alicyclobacillus sp. SO9 TaxID=2665646 RepID=UPI0018E789F2|nr:hypothetical protein [Alicyclobacillus sp. SO9]QQE80905.1 hypothetical protein GI364_11270 [Alicyclobacillus sp. SO9]